MRTRPRAAAWILGVALASAAVAQPLPDSQHVVDVSSLGGSFRNWGPVPMSAAGDWTGEYLGLVSYDCQAVAQTFGGTRPMATATAEAHGVAITQAWPFRSHAVSGVEYWAKPRQINVPPNTFPYIPAYVFIRGHATGYATSIARVNWQTTRVDTITGTQDYDIAIPVVFDPVNSPAINVWLSAEATGFEFTANRPHSSEAVADPLFVFDQAAFDAEMGELTFNLSDYFEFEYSLGIIEMPPPQCDPDVNQDGNADQDDVSYLIDVIGGADNPTGIDPDFNQDGNVDQDDVLKLIDVVGGAGC